MTLHSPEAQRLSHEQTDCEIVLGSREGAVDWQSVFGNDLPVELELGSGKGRFIIRSALQFPEKNFFGVERAAKFFHIMKQRICDSAALNIRILKADADDFIRNYVAPGSVAACHIYFPDPWPKTRHRKRRLINPGFLQAVKEALAVNGTVFFATDYADYFKVMVASAASTAGLEEVYRTTIQPVEAEAEEAATHYERKYLMQGRPIYKGAYKKC